MPPFKQSDHLSLHLDERPPEPQGGRARSFNAIVIDAQVIDSSAVEDSAEFAEGFQKAMRCDPCEMYGWLFFRVAPYRIRAQSCVRISYATHVDRMAPVASYTRWAETLSGAVYHSRWWSPRTRVASVAASISARPIPRPRVPSATNRSFINAISVALTDENVQ